MKNTSANTQRHEKSIATTAIFQTLRKGEEGSDVRGADVKPV